MPAKRSKSNSPAARPLASAAHFALDWGGPAGSDGFSRVEVGPLTAGAGELRLTRAVDGRTDLVEWLQAKPAGGRTKGLAKGDWAKGRTLVLSVRDSAGGPVARYRFAEAMPVALELGALDALAGGVLTETLTVRFASMRMER